MQRIEVIERVQKYFVHQVLDGRSAGLDETTPILEWGLINSIEIVRLLNFIHKELNVEIPAYQITNDNFMNIGTIADMVLRNQITIPTLGPDTIH
ncbi:acyl carrier protein [Ktedonobacteria bacterium brp13]|nr:acyl carrier protein [Ktedonobacteria bacterium brp13]